MESQMGAYARDLAKQYRALENDLTNQYVQLKTQKPFQEFPELARAVWRVAVLREGWHGIAYKIAEQRDYRGG